MEEQKPSAEVARWADKAMFEAEPMDAGDGPKVYLLWMTPDPLGAIAAACKMYKGEVVRDLRNVNDRERLEYLEQIQKTKLKAPFEFVKFHFLIEGVTRSFTHQLVRQRTAVYAQESLRFAVKSDLPVGLPPSLSEFGQQMEDGRTLGDRVWEEWGEAVSLPPNQQARQYVHWRRTLEIISEEYNILVENGMPAEDARGLLPHNVLTRVHYSTDLRALLDHAGNRLCTQAQFEWRLVFAKIVEAIRDATIRTEFPSIPQGDVYMADRLADLFKPVCYQTGRCEFKANFDRACSIRDRVDANESIGRPSSEWGQEKTGCGADSDCPGGCDMETQIIAPIKPGEWLLDPGAAREK